MYGRAPNKAEREHMDAVAGLGCFCCRYHGIENDYVLIHHARGRTTPDCHFYVIGLCSPHHDYHHKGSLHHNLSRWESIYGTQESIVEKINDELAECAYEQQCNSFEGYNEK